MITSLIMLILFKPHISNQYKSTWCLAKPGSHFVLDSLQKWTRIVTSMHLAFYINARYILFFKTFLNFFFINTYTDSLSFCLKNFRYCFDHNNGNWYIITPLHRMNNGIDRWAKDGSWKSSIFQRHLTHDGSILELLKP